MIQFIYNIYCILGRLSNITLTRKIEGAHLTCIVTKLTPRPPHQVTWQIQRSQQPMCGSCQDDRSGLRSPLRVTVTSHCLSSLFQATSQWTIENNENCVKSAADYIVADITLSWGIDTENIYSSLSTNYIGFRRRGYRAPLSVTPCHIPWRHSTILHSGGGECKNRKLHLTY